MLCLVSHCSTRAGSPNPGILTPNPEYSPHGIPHSLEHKPGCADTLPIFFPRVCVLTVMTFVDTLPVMTTKDKKFQLRLEESERKALHRVAKRKGVSAADYILGCLRKDAKKMGIPI